MSSVNQLSLRKGETIFHYAVRENKLSLAKRLFEAGYSPWQPNAKGQSAFEYAEILGHRKIGAFILKNEMGIKPSQIQHRYNRSILGSALSAIQSEIDGLKSKSTETGKMPLLHQHAAWSEKPTNLLLKATPKECNTADLNGLTPLHHALLNGNEIAVQLLLLKTNPKFIDADGRTYLHFAAMSGKPHLIALIAKSMRLDYNHHDQFSLTPIHYFSALSSDGHSLIELSKMGASLTAETKEKISPISLLFARSYAKEEPLASGTDFSLAAMNAVGLAAMLGSFWLTGSYTIPRAAVGSAVGGIRFIQDMSNFTKMGATGSLPTAQGSVFLQYNISFLGHMVNAGLAGVTGIPFQNSNAVATVYTVGKRSLDKISDAALSFPMHRSAAVVATAVHLFNFGCSLIDAKRWIDAN